MLGSTEILIICGVIFLLFGASAIPKLARSIGKARNEFEKGLKENSSKPDNAELSTGSKDSETKNGG
jgi:sec-independent protein translocase protein TatA